MLGSMRGAVKAQNLQRDWRFALHAYPSDKSMTGGDAKLSDQAIKIIDPSEIRAITEVEPPLGAAQYFRLDLSEVVMTTIGENQQHLLIRLWRPARGVVTFKRYT